MARPTRYEELLDAAEAIVRRDGSSRLTLDAVAAEAGVSKGGLLYHFPSKEALVAAMVERMLAEFDEAHERAAHADPHEPGRWTRAYVLVTAGSGGPSEHETSAALLAAVAADPSLLDPARERYAEWRRRAADDGIAPEDAAIVALAADGLWMADLFRLAAPAGEERRRLLERMLELAGGA